MQLLAITDIIGDWSMVFFLPLFMIFAHIVDDFYLQGVLAKLKQKSYWKDENNYPTLLRDPKKMDKYSMDWFPALLMHCISWSFMIHLPIIILSLIGAPYGLDIKVLAIFVYISFTINAVIHFIVDHLKANKYEISLVTDQTIHIMQIVITFIVYLMIALYLPT